MTSSTRAKGLRRVRCADRRRRSWLIGLMMIKALAGHHDPGNAGFPPLAGSRRGSVDRFYLRMIF
jgi:hypothetical protein